MLHDAPRHVEPRDAAAERWNARWGLLLFAVYALGYGGFVGVAAFRPAAMATEYSGLNLAIWWGFGLIIGAFLLALLYAAGCKTPSHTGRPR
jgi:uncharacterized membrane protein (DUF485 family)